jgi:hypothetical protein
MARDARGLLALAGACVRFQSIISKACCCMLTVSKGAPEGTPWLPRPDILHLASVLIGVTTLAITVMGVFGVPRGTLFGWRYCGVWGVLTHGQGMEMCVLLAAMPSGYLGRDKWGSGEQEAGAQS